MKASSRLFFPTSLLAALLAAGSLHAQDSLPDFPTRPISALSDDRAEAAELIAGSGHPALFENLTDHQGPAVRHRSSGMVCRFEARGRYNQLVVYHAQGAAQDIGCNTYIDGVFLTHYAYRYSEPADPEAEAMSALQAVRERYGDLRDYEGQIASLSVDETVIPNVYVARMVVDTPDGETMTRVTTSLVEGWILKQRMSVPLAEALHGDLWSGGQFLRVQLEVLDHAAGREP